MEKYQLHLTTELIYQLLKGKKLEQKDGVFITREELQKIISDRTNMTERLLKIMES